MTTFSADAREVVLATIRERLLDDDVNVLRLDADADDRHIQSIAEHALDAALARGAALADVHTGALSDLARLAPDLWSDCSDAIDPIFDSRLDHLADTPIGRWDSSAPADIRDQTVSGIRRSQTTVALYLLANAISRNAGLRVRDVFIARARERGLGSDAKVGDVMDERERVELYRAGLYGEEAPAS